MGGRGGAAFVALALAFASTARAAGTAGDRAADERAAAAAPGESPTVSVRLLSRLRPRALSVSGPVRLTARAEGDRLIVDGRPSAPIELPSASWRVRAGGEVRRYEGALSLAARDGEVVAVLRAPLEAYVAATVAAETTPGTGAPALRAQAIVARSWTLAAGPRHPEADRCDLAHCQVLSGRGPARHLAAARDAAAATAGVVLLLPDGGVALTPFHAACGGHTADPVQLFGAPDRSGAVAVADPACPAERWSARIPKAVWAAAARDVLGEGPVDPTALSFDRGAGGFAIRMRERDGGRVAPADAFVRALGARAGWSTIRSSRFDAAIRGELVLVRGSGLGHGVGLCQAGAARLAATGLDHPAILARYFPGARLGPNPEARSPSETPGGPG